MELGSQEPEVVMFMSSGSTSKYAHWKRTRAATLAACVVALAPWAAFGQTGPRVPASNGGGMDTHLFRPAVDSKGFFYVNGSDVLVHNKFSFGLILDWGHALMRTSGAGGERAADPIGADGLPCDPQTSNCVPNAASGGTGVGNLVDNSFQGTISASYGLFNRAVVGLTIPINVMVGERAYGIGPDGGQYSTGQLNSQTPSAIVPHAKFRFLRATDILGLAVALQVGIPIDTAARDLGGEPGFWYWPRVIIDKHLGIERQWKIALDVGYRGHAGTNPSFGSLLDGSDTQLSEGALTYGDLLTYGLGVSFRAAKYLDLVAEHYGSYLVGGNSASAQRPSGELLGGIKLFVEQNSYLFAAGGSRALLFSGFEAADARVVLGFVYEPSIGDKDGDGILDDVDECPDDPEDFDKFEDADGCPDPDNDNDGILDVDDRCPNIPEDKDGDEDIDGCPEGDKRGDRDGDGIYDDVDKCPDDPEDRDGFEDEDGCPDPDNDKDGILDREDQCPDDPEDFDKFEDTDGCPELDNDLDRIPDGEDQCPNDPETYNGHQDNDGCPDKGKVIIEGNDIVILEKINFATASDQILPGSIPIVEAVAATLKGHPEFLVIEVAGHADERGEDDYNLNLTKRRAASVLRALTQRGVKESRIVSQGYGEYCPIDNQSNPVAWEKNRRVDFKVVKTQDGMTGVKRGCIVAKDYGIDPPTVR